MYPNEAAGRGVLVGAMQAKADEARQPQVQRSLDELAHVAAALMSTAEALEKRLSTVLNASAPEDKPNHPPKPVLVPVAEHISSQAAVLYTVHRRLDSILSRLEV